MLEPLPTVQPPLRGPSPFVRQLPAGAAWDWLAAGWRDLCANPAASIAYGLAVLTISVFVIWALVVAELPWLILPALSGFLVVGPFVAIGLYEKSRRLAAGKAVRLSDMVLVRPASGGQILFAGLLGTAEIESAQRNGNQDNGCHQQGDVAPEQGASRGIEICHGRQQLGLRQFQLRPAQVEVLCFLAALAVLG